MNWAESYISHIKKQQQPKPAAQISREEYALLWKTVGEYLYPGFEMDSVQQKIMQAVTSTPKGVMIVGSKGIGKSVAMDIFHHILSSALRLNVYCTDVPELEFLYRCEGAKALRPAIESRYLILNDITRESELNDYGTNRNIISDIFFMRYRSFQTRGFRTFCTGNNGAGKLADRYGSVLAERFREMFEYVEVKGESRR